MGSAGVFEPGKLWSLWDIMKAFNAGLLGATFKRLMEYAQAASTDDVVYEQVSKERKEDIDLTLAAALTIAYFVELPETRDAINRLKSDLAREIIYVDLQHTLHHLMELMQSELEKRKGIRCRCR